MTENSIYIVSGTIEKKIIGVSKMLQEGRGFLNESNF